MLKYEDTPLSEVIDGLSRLAGINIHLDPRGLSQEGVDSDTPVTINLSKEISLKSALNLILEPLHLSYVDQGRSAEDHQRADCATARSTSKIYNVADLVIPIPNFVPNNNIGLQGLINDAHAAMGYGNGGLGVPVRPCWSTIAARPERRRRRATTCMAQQFGAVGDRQRRASPAVPIGGGPGGLGGGAQRRLRFADRPDRVDRRAPKRWAENGGGEARNPAVPDEPEPGHQPDAGGPRGDRRPAGAACAACRICR